MKKEFVVTFKTSAQISHDDFEVFTEALKVDLNTTMEDILYWYKSRTHAGSKLHVVISELDILNAAGSDTGE